MGFDKTVSHWMWCVDSLDTGAAIQLGQCDCIKYYIGHIILFVKQMIVY